MLLCVHKTTRVCIPTLVTTATPTPPPEFAPRLVLIVGGSCLVAGTACLWWCIYVSVICWRRARAI